MPRERHRPANVLIVEDEQCFAERVIAPHFEDDWRVQIVYNVPQSLQAIEAIVDLKLAIVDLDIPGGAQDIKVSGGAGFEVIEVLMKRFPRARIVVLTAHNTDLLLNKTHRLGIEFVSKCECAPNLDLIASELLKEELLGDLEPTIAAAKELSKQSYLTAKQSEVLMLLVRGFSRAEIMQEMDIGAFTLKSHVRQIVKKTGFARTEELLRSLRRKVCDV